MQPCSPAPKARPFWRAPRALTIFGPARSRVRRVSASATPATRPKRAGGEGTRRNTARNARIGIGMAETTEKTGEKKLSVSPSKTLTLKGRGVEQGVVRQSFSHGRTKAVVVEKVKSRIPTRAKGDAPASSAAAAKRPATGKPAAPTAAAATTPAAPAPAAKPAGGMVLRSLTEEEQKARVHALNDARLREAEERKIAEEEAFVRTMREAAERTEREAAEARKADEEKRRKHDLEAKLKAEQEAKKRFGEESAAAARPGARPALEPDEDEAPRTRRGPGAARPAPAPKPARGGGQKSRGRLTLVTALSADEERERSVAAFRRRVQRLKGHTADEPNSLIPRSAVVTVMGHVDHGKTSLLDAIRSTEVAAGEAGGITQHIGAYQVTAPSGNKITFIDTPGHAAFTAMRARGAKVTDIVVLVVAADDGVMPQTVEAINHAKAARVPMIVAINKIDRPDAKPERVRTELLQHEVQVESLGGQVLDVEVSATKKLNIDRLLETIGLQSEILDLKANPSRPAEGTVIEAKLDRGRGPVATVLVQRGTLRVGDLVVAGADWGRVRALVSDTGTPVETAGPSTPVEVLGFNGTPEAGDRLAVVQTEARAREVTAYRARQRRDKMAARATGMRGSLEQMMSQLKAAGRKDLALIVKADVQGSLEAVIGAIDKLATEEVGARVIHSGVGGITESDVTLAEASGVPIIGFNVRAHKEAREAAERVGIEIRYYNIIYDLVDDVKKAMSGLLAPTIRETMLGNATILEIFKVSKVGNIAGCRVTDGVVERGANVRLIRDNVVVHEGKLSQLKRFKDDARQVVAGQECGMAFENYQDMKVGDVIECYRVETIQRSL